MLLILIGTITGVFACTVIIALFNSTKGVDKLKAASFHKQQIKRH
jgi:hypothetical protein